MCLRLRSRLRLQTTSVVPLVHLLEAPDLRELLASSTTIHESLMLSFWTNLPSLHPGMAERSLCKTLLCMMYVRVSLACMRSPICLDLDPYIATNSILVTEMIATDQTRGVAAVELLLSKHDLLSMVAKILVYMASYTADKPTEPSEHEYLRWLTFNSDGKSLCC